MIRQLSIYLLLLLLFIGSFAQPYNYRFHNYSPDVLGAKSVYSFVEDDFGFIWLGTDNGLKRFDGNHFKSYADQLFGDEEIYDLTIDSKQNLWIAASNGAFHFDRATEKIIEIWDLFKIGASDATALAHLESEIWIGSSDGLYHINLKDSTTQLISKETNKQIHDNNIFDILPTDDGNLYISTLNGGLIFFNATDGSFTSYLAGSEGAISSNVLRNLYQTNDGSLLIGTESNGLNLFNKDSSTFEQVIIDLDNYDCPTSSAYSIIQDEQGRIWLGTWANGLILIDKENNETHQFINDAFDQSSISGNFAISLFQSSTGDIWIGTYEFGLSRLNLEEQKITRFTQENEEGKLQTSVIRSIYEDNEGVLWIGAGQGGLYRYDSRSGAMQSWLTPDGSRDGLARGTIWSISESADESFLWFGTSRGVGTINKSTYQLEFIEPDDSDNSLVGNNVLKVLDDQNGSLWVGTWYGGLNRLDIETGEWNYFGHKADDPTSLASNNVNDIFIDSKNRVWVATDASLSRFMGDNQGFTNLSIAALMIAEDKEGTILVTGSEDGLFQFDERTNQLVPWAFNNELNELYVKSILIDSNNNFWIHSDEGVNLFGNGKITHFGFLDGLSGRSSLSRSAFIGPSGKIYFGGAEGLSILDPDDLPMDRQPKLELTDLLLLNQSVTVSDSSILKENIENTEKLTLSYKDYVFAIEFTVLDFQHVEEINYTYKLEGFDQDWIHTQNSNRKAVYTNVPPGNYTFIVKATDQFQGWDPVEKKLEIRIIPPWWKTRWAITLFIIAIVLTIYAYINFRISRVKRQKAILEEEVKNRTNEIATQKDAIEEQAKSLADLNSQKNQLIGIISHDVRNPLASLKSITELLDPSILTSDQLEDIRNQMSRQLEGLTESVITLLDWAKSQMDGEEMNVETIDLSVLGKEMEKLYELPLNKKGILFKNEIRENCFASADANQIRAVLRNLLSNAIKFSSAGETITLAIDNKKSTSEFLTVVIRDTGKGMSEGTVKDLFSNQVISTKGTSGESGTGLGLILVKDFVEKNKGTVWVESELNEGSSFYFTLPIPTTH